MKKILSGDTDPGDAGSDQEKCGERRQPMRRRVVRFQVSVRIEGYVKT